MGQMQFPAGQRQASKYGGKTGPNYAKWGEQEARGYVYNPATDTYYYDPKVEARYRAQLEKDIKDEFTEKPPSIYEQAAATALPLVAAAGAKSLFSDPKGGFIGGLLGLGEKKAPDYLSDFVGLGGGSSASSSLGDFADAISDVGSGIIDYGGDILSGIGDYAGDAWDYISGLF